MFKTDKTIREELAACYHIFASLGMDDLTYTHLSSRSEKGNSFFIYPFGYLFKEVTASNLLEVSFDGQILSGSEYQYNKTGFVIHGAIYQNKPNINAVFHLHTIAGVAVSALKKGLMPISQFAFHFYENIAYHQYSSLVLDYKKQAIHLVEDLGDYNAMFLRNHGILTCGVTVQEALFYMYYLEKACQVQCSISSHDDLIIPSEDICRKARDDMRNFEPNLGQRDWQAFIRELERTGINYKK